MAKDQKVEEEVAVASGKIRQLEDNLLFRHITDSDKTSTWQQANITPPTGKLPSENTEELYKDVVGSAINILRGGSGEIYDDEGNVIAIGGSSPDIALSPFISKQALSNLFKKTSNKLFWKMSKKSRKRIEKTAEATPVQDTKRNLLKFLENRSKKKLYKTLATKEEFEKFKNTFPDPGKKWNYKQYEEFLKEFMYENLPPIMHRLGKTFPAKARYKDIAALGTYSPNIGIDRSNIIGRIKMAEGYNYSQWGSTLRHEIKHVLDDAISNTYSTSDYKKLEKLFRSKLKPEIEKKLSAWEVVSKTGKHFTGHSSRPPSDVQRIQYLLKPTETLARSTQLKTKGIGQTLSELVGRPINPRKDLKEIYPKDFIKELQEKYWAAAPLSIALNKELEE